MIFFMTVSTSIELHSIRKACLKHAILFPAEGEVVFSIDETRGPLVKHFHSSQAASYSVEQCLFHLRGSSKALCTLNYPLDTAWNLWYKSISLHKLLSLDFLMGDEWVGRMALASEIKQRFKLNIRLCRQKEQWNQYVSLGTQTSFTKTIQALLWTIILCHQ